MLKVREDSTYWWRGNFRRRKVIVKSYISDRGQIPG